MVLPTTTEENHNMANHTSDWYATTQAKCPEGDPGVYVGEVSNTRFPVIRDVEGLLWYQYVTGLSRLLWTPMRGWSADRFEPDVEALPDWAERCTHDPVCTVERDCDALHAEQGSGDW